MEAQPATEGKYAGLSKGQIKKLKEKEKKEREAAAAGTTGADQESAKVEADLEESKAGDAASKAAGGGKAKKGKKGKGGISDAMKAKIAEQ
jgi:hypothetical protein